MKVKDAISELKKLNPEMEILDHVYDGTYDKPNKISVITVCFCKSSLGGDYSPKEYAYDSDDCIEAVVFDS